MEFKFTIKSKNGKILAGASSIEESKNLVEFYERNEPEYKPCRIINNDTLEIEIPSKKEQSN